MPRHVPSFFIRGFCWTASRRILPPCSCHAPRFLSALCFHKSSVLSGIRLALTHFSASLRSTVTNVHDSSNHGLWIFRRFYDVLSIVSLSLYHNCDSSSIRLRGDTSTISQLLFKLDSTRYEDNSSIHITNVIQYCSQSVCKPCSGQWLYDIIQYTTLARCAP